MNKPLEELQKECEENLIALRKYNAEQVGRPPIPEEWSTERDEEATKLLHTINLPEALSAISVGFHRNNNTYYGYTPPKE